MKIKALTPEDWRAWKKLRLESLQNAPASFGSSYLEEVNWPDSRFEDTLKTDTIIAAFDHHELIGYVGFHRFNALKTQHRGLVWGLYIVPEFRGKGIADTLMQSIITFAKAHVVQLHLSCVTENLAAIALYKKHGFTVYGTEPNANKIQDTFFDKHLMVLDLRDNET